MEMATHVNCGHAMEQRVAKEKSLSMSDGCEMLKMINAVNFFERLHRLFVWEVYDET